NWNDFRRVTANKAPFLVRSVDMIEELVARERLDCEFRRDGTLYVYRDASELARSQWLPRALGEVGIRIDPLDGAQVEALEPALKPGVAGGYFNPGDASLNPQSYVAELARVVRARGALIQEGTAVQSIARERGRISAVG